MLQHASNLGPSRVRWQHSPQICKTVRDYESVWYGKMIIAQWSLQVCFASKSHWVTVHKRLVQCLGKPFGGVVPVFGLALHRGIQVKFQKSLGGKGNFAGGSQQRRQNKSPHVAGENINLRFMFFIFSPFRKFGMVEELACVSARRHVGFRDLKCQITERGLET